MRRRIIVLIIVALVSTYCLAKGDVCRFGQKIVLDDNHFSIGAYVDNNDSLAGFQVPILFKLGELSITCDSVSFAGGRCEGFEFLDSKIDNQRHIVYISGVNNISAEADNEPLLPGRGEIARIYFTYEGDPGETSLRIKQAHYKMGGNRLEYRFWKPDATEVRCRFEAPPIQLPQ